MADEPRDDQPAEEPTVEQPAAAEPEPASRVVHAEERRTFVQRYAPAGAVAALMLLPLLIGFGLGYLVSEVSHHHDGDRGERRAMRFEHRFERGGPPRAWHGRGPGEPTPAPDERRAPG